ncbi:uncharacterized protein LOC126743782 [Anthonomus grandis grandis]|uniref:uncharacterized protein LOC126743782 n=1 Tax=Anthonomus grandis grandis TaxID=2921223 RepID=UPI0021653C5B|nr:uncharacterized protein LOC126743782 [Anthonomus grandis grandis]
MKRIRLFVVLLILCQCYAGCNGIYLNSSKVWKSDNPAIWTEEGGVWGAMLEDWALGGGTNHRTSRVMRIPISEHAYVIQDRVDTDVLLQKESKISGGKIVTSGPPTKITSTGSHNPYRPPPRQVSETDLYLLGAIEKLVYKVDFMEKRLRRVEEMLYYVMAGNRVDTEPCPDNFTRAGQNCYHFASNAGREYDWKVASKHCKKLGAVLAEMETIEENQDLVAYIQNDSHLKGKDFWVGGLNPGLLWIWSNTARPVVAPGSQNNKENPSAAIYGEGRCLRLAYNPALRSYDYKGTDCSVRYSYICEAPEETSSNEIKKIGRSMKIFED